MMERRLKLLEKLKSTKLNKLTVKQGGVDVKLNLKRDLGNQAVSIDDKVLDMLEKYVENQNNSGAAVTNSSASMGDDARNLDDVAATNRTLSSTAAGSPAKKVRFDVNSVQSTSPAENLATAVRLLGQLRTTSQTVQRNLQSSDRIDTPPMEYNDKEQEQSSSVTTQNNESRNAQNPEDQESTERKEFSCRLCKLKCSNERSLYEHVTRLHGGKGILAQQFISKLKQNNNTHHKLTEYDEEGEMPPTADSDENSDDLEYQDEEEEEEEGSDDELIDDTCASSSSDVTTGGKAAGTASRQNRLARLPFRKKIQRRPQSMMPRPNVAIRVAKVAYYNSKRLSNSTPASWLSSNAANPFKASIFAHGGIRGNFFSQERLQLRPCKIKMKIGSELKSNDCEDTFFKDDFLANTTQVVDLKSIDRNRTMSMQSSSNNKSAQEQLLSGKEIRLFFKSLISYIPLNSPRLKDLIIEHKSQLGLLLDEPGCDQETTTAYVTRCLLVIDASVQEAREFGISLFDLRRKVNEKLSGEKLKPLGVKQMRKMLDGFLIEKYVVLVVGVVEHVYVSHVFKEHWVIQSFKCLKGRGDFNETIIEFETPQSIETEEPSKESGADSSLTPSSEKRIRRPKQIYDDHDDYDTNVCSEDKSTATAPRNMKPVCLIPRPWRYIDGLLNRPVLKEMLESILLYLKTCPNSSGESIVEHYCPVLQPVMTRELLDMLERLKCVRRRVLSREQPCDLFSDFTNGSNELFDCLDDERLVGNECYVFHLTPNSVFTFKKVFPN